MPLFRIATRRCCTPGAWTIETHALDDAEAMLIAAIAEQLIPLDDEPGSSQCRAVRFIDQQLDGMLSRLRPAYHQGLRAFDAACRTETGVGFLDLTPEQRALYIRHVASGHKLTAFFELVSDHAKQSLSWHRLEFQEPFIHRQHAV